MTTILVEIGHAGHVHFFRPITKLLKKNDIDVIMYARNKPGCFSLIRHYNMRAFVQRNRDSNLTKLLQLIPRSFSINKLASISGVAALVGIHPVHSALASKFARTPSIAFADTDHAKEQMIIYGTLSDYIFTPRSFGWRFGKKHKVYSGFHELSYLHPNYFTPQKDAVEEFGLLDNGPPIVVRLISWDATHDIGVKHFRWANQLIRYLSKEYRVIISSEGSLPKSLKKFRNPLPIHEYHNLLAFSRMHIGSGATSTSEAAMLGVPAIYTNPLELGYINELEQKYHLVRKATKPRDILMACDNLLDAPPSKYQSIRKELLEKTCDVAAYAANQIEHIIR